MRADPHIGQESRCCSGCPNSRRANSRWASSRWLVPMSLGGQA